MIGDACEVFCLCPDYAIRCVHHLFLLQSGDERFPHDGLYNSRQFSIAPCCCSVHLFLEDLDVVLFSRVLMHERIYVEHFSVSSPMQRGIKSRAIVCHEGGQDGDGRWTCSKDALGRCAHIKLSKDHLQKLLRCDPLAADTGVSHASADVPGKCYSTGVIVPF